MRMFTRLMEGASRDVQRIKMRVTGVEEATKEERRELDE